jgi:hypothetical protein
MRSRSAINVLICSASFTRRGSHQNDAGVSFVCSKMICFGTGPQRPRALRQGLGKNLASGWVEGHQAVFCCQRVTSPL